MTEDELNEQIDQGTFDALRQITMASIQLIPTALKGKFTYERMGQILTIRDEIVALADKFGEA